MKFINENGINHSATKLVQADNIRVSTHRGHTLQNVIDNITRECENVSNPNTIKVTNKVNEFTIGQGVDIDVSGDVENSEVSFELEGQTYQNLIDSFYTIQSDTIKQDDDYVFNKEETQVAGGGIVWNVKFIKPTTTYTFIFKMEEISDIKWFQTDNHENYITKDVVKCGRYCGFQAIKFTTKDTLNKNAKFKLSVTGNSSFNTFKILKNVVLLEGDHTETPIDALSHYFTGIKSSFEDGNVNLTITGKNLFDLENVSFKKASDMRCDRIDNGIRVATTTVEGVYKQSYVLLQLEPKVMYCIHSKFTVRKGDPMIILKDKNGESFPNRKEGVASNNMVGTFITPDDGYVRIGFACTKGVNTSGDVDFFDIQLEKMSKPTSYEPYYKKTTSFNIGEPLRRLPNGICDEIRNNNGQWELVRRVRKVTINGSENWKRSYDQWANIVFCCKNTNLEDINFAPTHIGNVYSSTLPATNIAWLCSVLGKSGICTHHWEGYYLHIAKEGIQTVEQLKSWLSQNPTTVYYELTNPIITKIKPLKFAIKPSANVNINSDITPVSKHIITLNRAGQIEQGIVQIAELRNRVGKLETAYETHLLETQLKLSLLGLEYTLEKEDD